METENHCKNGANLKSHTSRGIFTVQMFVVLCLLFAGCSKDKNDDGDGGGTSSTAELDKAVYCMKYAIRVSTDYNDKKLSPNAIQEGSNSLASVSYNPNGGLGSVKIHQNKPLTSSVTVPFHIDMGRRPSTLCQVSSTDETVYSYTLTAGSYDYESDPAKLLACFGGYQGSDKFTSLDKLKITANNDGITEEVYNAIKFPTNCYKIIVFGKNKAGKLIGKYAGYSLGTSYIYWDINPESSSFGKSGNKSF